MAMPGVSPRRLAHSSAQLPCRPARGPGFVVETIAQVREPGIEPRKKGLGRQTAPRIRVHRLVPRGADAADNPARVIDAGENGGNIVGEFDPAVRRIEDVRRDLQAVPDLRPPPLGRIRSTDRRQVLRRVLRSGLGNGGGFRGGGVVLPQPGVRGKVIGPRRIESQRTRLARRAAAASIRSCPHRSR